MKKLVVLIASVAIIVLTLAGCSTQTVTGASTTNDPSTQKTGKKTLRPFRTDNELKNYLQKLGEQQTARRRESMPAPSIAATKSAPSDSKDASVARSTTGADSPESITNVQHAGVDEGGIVKLHGDYLVMLRRGRLFTVGINDRTLRPVSVINSYGPGIDPEDAWYDEMIISGDTIAVIGYSYGNSGTEIGLFHIDRAGGLSYRATYHLRSDDYYSSRNYASRLIGSKLIFYTPLELSPGLDEPFEEFPAIRRWHPGATEDEFRRIAPATRVYRPEQEISTTNGLALHTVTICDLASGDMKCEATAVIGAPGRVFYVSPGSVYIWVSDWKQVDTNSRSRSMLFRMPLDGSAPTALSVSGSPVDQFSFLESDDNQLNVLVRSEAAGDGMWNAEVSEGDVALLRLPLSSLSDGSEVAPQSSYRALPKPLGDTFQNRFIGDHLLYGTGSGWEGAENPESSKLYVSRYSIGDSTEISLPHGVDRIEAMGAEAVVIGTDGQNLHFTGIRLSDRPGIANTYVRNNASQGELRSHGFFYKDDGQGSGMLGLPISIPGRPGYEHLFEDSAAILYLRNDSMRFKEMGALAARSEGAVDDLCQASCTDWYGNARPLFIRGRVFALMGYEIVEGAIENGRIREIRRVSYAPRGQKVARST